MASKIKAANKVPPALMQNIQTLILGIVVCVICILIGFVSLGAVSFITFIGLMLMAILGVYAFILYRTYSSGNYDYITGICTGAHISGLRKQHMQMVIADSKNNIYSVKTAAKRRCKILTGDKVIIYIPKGLQLVKNEDGMYEINELYGFMSCK